MAFSWQSLAPVGNLLAPWLASREIPVHLPRRRHILGLMPTFPPALYTAEGCAYLGQSF